VASDAMRKHIEETLHWPTYVPDYLQQIDLAHLLSKKLGRNYSA
jgi:hypothetical protein